MKMPRIERWVPSRVLLDCRVRYKKTRKVREGRKIKGFLDQRISYLILEVIGNHWSLLSERKGLSGQMCALRKISFTVE